jgi:hypothetical protein
MPKYQKLRLMTIKSFGKKSTMTIKSFGKKLFKKNHLCSGSSEWSRGCSRSLTKMSFREEDESVRVKKKKYGRDPAR